MSGDIPDMQRHIEALPPVLKGAITRRILLGGIGGTAALAALGAPLVGAQGAKASIQWFQPFPYVKTPSYGFGDNVPDYDGYHYGVDWDTPPEAGDPIYAVAAGTVDGAGPVGSNGGLGYWVRVNHGGLWSVYAHMLPGSIAMSVGQSVSAGTLVGLVGNSGNTTGPHLHLEIRTTASGGWVDPMIYLNGAPAGGPAVSTTGDPMWYIRNLDTGYIAILGVGGKGYHLFASMTEYTDWMMIVGYANAVNGAGIPVPPAPGSVFGCGTALFDTALAIASGA